MRLVIQILHKIGNSINGFDSSRLRVQWRRPLSTSWSTEPNLSFFLENDSLQPRLRFLLGNSVNNIDLQCNVFSCCKTFITCLPSSVNSIFDDVKYYVIPSAFTPRSNVEGWSTGQNFSIFRYVGVSGRFLGCERGLKFPEIIVRGVFRNLKKGVPGGTFGCRFSKVFKI